MFAVIFTNPSAMEVRRVKGFGRGGFFRVVGGILSSGRELKATKSNAPSGSYPWALWRLAKMFEIFHHVCILAQRKLRIAFRLRISKSFELSFHVDLN